MANPTPTQIAAAYTLIGNAEKSVLTALKESGQTYLAAIDAAAAGLPLQTSPQSPSLQNIVSWRNTIASIVASVESYLGQYPSDEVAPENPA